MREYEITLIASAQLPEMECSRLVEKYEKLLTQDGGQVIRKNVWGMRKLAYPIKTQYRGFYAHYDLVGKPENLAEAKRLMRIDEHILRYLAIKIGEDVDVEARKAELARIEARAAAHRSEVEPMGD